MPRRENTQQLSGSPQRMLTAQGAQQLRELGVDLVRAVVRGATPIAEPAPAFLLESLNPLVANAATHAVAGAEFRHGESVAPRVFDEPDAFFHRGSLQPRHRAPRRPRRRRAS